MLKQAMCSLKRVKQKPKGDKMKLKTIPKDEKKERYLKITKH